MAQVDALLATGEPIENRERLFPFAPIQTQEGSQDKVLTEAARLAVNLASAPRKVHIGRGTGKAGDVEITAKQRNACTKAEGEFAHEILSGIVNSPLYDSLKDTQRLGLYQRIIRNACKQASFAALPPEARIAKARRIAQEMLQGP